MSTVQEIAARTLADLREHGWLKGELVPDDEGVYDEDGKFLPEYLDTCRTCLLGAAGRVELGSPLAGDDVQRYTPEFARFLRAVRVTTQALPTFADDIYPSRVHADRSAVYRWNDADYRIFQDVELVLETIAQREEAA